MKKTLSSEDTDRFSGNLRHYHRTSAPTQRSWDDWVDGDLVKSRKSWNWAKTLGVLLGLLILAGIIIGLVFALR